MSEVRTKFLFRLYLEVGPHHVVGTTPFGSRRVAPISGGMFEGQEVSGTVLPGGADWMTVDPAGAWFRINVQVPLRTQDGEFLTMAYQGFRSGPPEVLERVSRGEPVDANSYYYRGLARSRRHRRNSPASIRWLPSASAGGRRSDLAMTCSRSSDRAARE